MRFVDSHLHLEGTNVSEVVPSASANETLLVVCGIDRETSLDALSQQVKNPEIIRGFVGVHPSEAGKENDLGWVKTSLQKASGVGEIGLDPKYSSIDEEGTQSRTFRTLLEAAQEMEKPVQVHSRGAEEECLKAMDQFSLKSVLMHWFEEEERLRAVLDRGYFVSVGPAILYSKRLQRMVAQVDRDLLLVESDSPVPYAPLGGVRGPSLVPSVVFKIAELWGLEFDKVRDRTVSNAIRFLDLPGKG